MTGISNQSFIGDSAVYSKVPVLKMSSSNQFHEFEADDALC